MSDRERDQIDQDAQTFIRTCSTAIQSLKDGGLLIAQIYTLLPGSFVCISQSGSVCVGTKSPFTKSCPLLMVVYNLDQKLTFFVVVSQKNSEQVTEHRCNVLEILQKYLKGTKHAVMYIYQ